MNKPTQAPVADGALKAEIARVRNLPAVAAALDLLARNLPPYLSYHAKSHTEDVLNEAVRFAVMDQLTQREVELLAIAAAFHDAGFTKTPIANESIGAELARRCLMQIGGYSPSEIGLIEQMILDTALVELPNGPQQVPSTNLSRYLLDADLSNLGREDFFDKGELQRKELNLDEEHFRKRSLQLLSAHRWFTDAARALRQKKKQENLLLLKSMVSPAPDGPTLSFDRVGFLAKLPLLLNASLDSRKVIKASLNELKTRLGAEAATIFLFDHQDNSLCFWAMHGPRNESLERAKIAANKGCVGWVLEHQASLIVNDVASDSRFFPEVDQASGFTTRNLMCAPLTVRMADRIGAVEVLNKLPGDFSTEDLEFLEEFAGQISLAIENARLHESVRDHNRQLELLDQRKNELMSLIVRKFRLPMQLIGGSAAELEKSPLADPALRERMQRDIQDGVDRLSLLIAGIRSLSITSDEFLSANRSATAVAPLVEGVVRTFQRRARDRGVSLEQAVATDASTVYGDEELLTLALSHLVSNALDNTPSGGRIQLKAYRNGELICFEVHDTGIGISLEHQALIFERFYRLTRTETGGTTEPEAGHGLGLPTVQAILRAHGSKCSVSSSPGKGSTFSFALASDRLS